MVNEIVSGVCRKLKDQFNCEVFTEPTKKKEALLNKNKAVSEITPYFFVCCKNPKSGAVKDRYFTNKQLLGNRYLRSVGLCVEYRPAVNGNEKSECTKILDELFDCLEYVDLDDDSNNAKIRGYGMQGELSENNDVLSFFVTYDVFVFYEDSKNNQKMEKLNLKEEFLWH